MFKELILTITNHFEMNTLTLLTVCLVPLFTIIFVYLCKLWFSYSFFKKRGIKTRPWSFIYGHVFQLKRNGNHHDNIREWTKDLGSLYGYYDGHVPNIVTTDLDFIQEVFIKQASSFTARRLAPMEGDDSSAKGILKAIKDRWKRMRLIINPTFSSAKIKEMSPLLENCTDRLLKLIEDKPNEEIAFSDYLKRFTMDSIWNCAFGLDIDAQNNTKSEYLLKSEDILSSASKLTYPVLISSFFPELNFLLIPLTSFYNNKILPFFFGSSVDSRTFLFQKIQGIIDLRKSKDVNTRRDFMQLLLEAEVSDTILNDHNKLTTDASKFTVNKKLTHSEVAFNLFNFMLAGYETTSTSLSYCTYVLATNQEEQQTLRDEIDDFYDNNPDMKPDSDNVKELKYLDMFIKEILRMYPIAFCNRRCVKATTVKGIDIPVGTIINIDTMTLHYDPDIWGPTDPEKFNPLRFSPEIKRNPLVYNPFGQGPRNCVGMKFALVEMKLALVKILKSHEIHPSANTPSTIKSSGNFLRRPIAPICVQFKKRN